MGLTCSTRKIIYSPMKSRIECSAPIVAQWARLAGPSESKDQNMYFSFGKSPGGPWELCLVDFLASESKTPTGFENAIPALGSGRTNPSRAGAICLGPVVKMFVAHFRS